MCYIPIILGCYCTIFYVANVHIASTCMHAVLPGGVCYCNDCFDTGSYGTCVDAECKDWHYNQEYLECDDNRPRQLTAFLLSFFISLTGAANFYIGRNDLGSMMLCWRL